MVKTSFDRHSGILDSKFEDNITVEELVDYIRATQKNKSYPRTLKILTDATRAHMNFSPSGLQRIVEANYKSLDEYNFIIDAIVLESRRETALSVLYQELSKTQKYKFEIFATRKSALQWLEKQEPKV